MVLEDDFCFTSNLNKHREDWALFFERNYDYDVCLLGTSKYHLTEQYDDLLSRSYQECTTTSGYLVSSTGLAKLKKLWQESVPRLIETRDHSNVLDRSWSGLQSDGEFFFFTRKMGFQRPGFSIITGKTDFYMD